MQGKISLILFLALLSKPTIARRWGSSYWMENLDDAYFDMSKNMGNGVTQVEWQLDRQTLTPTRKSPTSPLSDQCSLKFLSERNAARSSNVVMFSTGEIGYWKVKNPSSAPILTASYDKALSTSHRILEIEVPSKVDRSVLVYELFIGGGSVQPLAVVGRGKGKVLYYDGGKRESEMGDDLGVEVGNVVFHVKGGKSIVDPSWAKGRRWFWSPREQRGMKSVF